MARSERATLAGRAAAINAAHRRLRARGGVRLPALLFFTDPARTPDPVAIAQRLPRGAGVVFRSFGAADRMALGRRLAATCRRRGLRFLVGADAPLARALRADGVHLPERMAPQARALRARFRIITIAAHSSGALKRAADAQADAAALSAVFASESSSAGRPLGAQQAGRLARAAAIPVYALGGVDARNARRLSGLGFCGLAAVSALARDPQING